MKRNKNRIQHTRTWFFFLSSYFLCSTQAFPNFSFLCKIFREKAKKKIYWPIKFHWKQKDHSITLTEADQCTITLKNLHTAHIWSLNLHIYHGSTHLTATKYSALAHNITGRMHTYIHTLHPIKMQKLILSPARYFLVCLRIFYLSKKAKKIVFFSLFVDPPKSCYNSVALLFLSCCCCLTPPFLDSLRSTFYYLKKTVPQSI